MRVKMISGICGVILILVSGVTLAQTNGVNASGAVQAPAPKPPNFPILFPSPSNNNGYEEWVQAGDLVQNDPILAEFPPEQEMTLAMKRRTLANPAVAQALHLVRAGLQKPVYSPRLISPRTIADEGTYFPELGPFIRLARLLRIEQYVAFADGRVDKAIETLRVELAFGHRIQLDSLLGGMFGTAINGTFLKQFSQHLDQLSTYHCEEVRRLVEDSVGVESPAAHLIDVLRASALKVLESRRSDTKGLLALMKELDQEEDDPVHNVAPAQAYLANHPGDTNAVLNEARDRVNAMYDQVLLNMRLPIAQRKPFVDDKSTSPGAVLFRVMTMDLQWLLDRYTREQAQMRLLGVHVLIHHYRWDHNTLPNSLAELHADDLIKDSFSGIQIVYLRDGDHYTLTTLGVPEAPQ